MNDVRKMLKISSIINFILGVTIFVLGGMIYSAFFFALGYLILVFSGYEDEDLKRNKTAILVIGLITIPLNLFTSIFLIIANDKIHGYEKKVNGENAPPVIYKKKVDPEVRKIDILLKLGVGMVFISGILFATTSWHFITDLFKAIALIVFGVFFIGLSLFTEKKLKLYKSAYMYWLLGVSFFLLSVVAMLYFGVFGTYLTYTLDGKYLAYVITYFTVLGLSFATYLKYPKKYLLYIVYMSIILIVTNILKHFSIDNALTVSVITTMIFFANAFSKENSTLSDFSKVISYLLFVFVLKNVSTSNELLVVISAVINIVNLYYLTNKEDNAESIINLLITYLLLSVSVYNLSALREYSNFIYFMLITLHTLVVRFNLLKVSKAYSYTNFALYTFASLIVCLIATQGNEIVYICISAIYLLANMCIYKKVNNDNDVPAAMCFEPLIIIFLLDSILTLKVLNIDLSEGLFLSIITVIYCFTHLIGRNQMYKNTYFISIILGALLTIFANSYAKDLIPTILIVVPSLYLFYLSNKKEENWMIVLSYILVLLSFYNMTSITNILELNTILSSIIFTWIIIIFIILSKKTVIKTTSYFAILLPIYDVIRYCDFDRSYYLISLSILILYTTFLIIKLFAKEEPAKSVVMTIGIILAITGVLEVIIEPVCGIYVGLIGIIAIIIGSFKKEAKPVFITGLVITILNIIIQLNNLWDEIPFWLYLLIGGLTLIGIVTYKEIMKSKEK